MSWAIISYAFAVGMAATLNPCGAAMLPAYLAWFTRSEQGSPPAVRVSRAVLAGLVVTAGFVVVFGVVGAMVSAGLSAFMNATPYIGVAVGAVLVIVGVLTAAGRHISVRLPGSDRPIGSSGGRGPGAMLGFGISYGLASLGCALPLFLAGVTVAFTQHGTADGIGAFLAYALGMGVVLTAVAVMVAVAPQARLRSLRSLGGRLERPAGVLLAAVGTYIVYYWVAGTLVSTTTGTGLIGAVDHIASTIASHLTGRVGVALAVLVLVTVATTFGTSRLRRRPVDPPGDHRPSAAPPDAPPAGRAGPSIPWPARHPRLRRALPFIAVGTAAALVEVVVLSTAVTSGSGSSPSAVAQIHNPEPVSASMAQMLSLEWLTPGQAGTPAPFTLTDQHGLPVGLDTFRGKAVVLSFNDNHCQSLCPLYAQDVKAAVTGLGPLAGRVAFVGVNVNPFHPGVSADQAFDTAHGLAGVPEWHFLTGSLPTLESVWRAYGEQPIVDPHHTAAHDPSIRFITPTGKLRGVAMYGPGSADATKWGYALATVAELLLGTHAPLEAHTPPAASTAPVTSTTAPPFTIPNLNPAGAAKVSLADLRGQPVVLNFFASWCSACQAEAADIETAAKRFAPHVAVVGVDVNDSRSSALDFAESHHLSYPIGFDHSGSVAASYGVTGLPTTVFISASGRTTGRHVGRITSAQLDTQLQRLEATAVRPSP